MRLSLTVVVILLYTLWCIHSVDAALYVLANSSVTAANSSLASFLQANETFTVDGSRQVVYIAAVLDVPDDPYEQYKLNYTLDDNVASLMSTTCSNSRRQCLNYPCGVVEVNYFWNRTLPDWTHNVGFTIINATHSHASLYGNSVCDAMYGFKEESGDEVTYQDTSAYTYYTHPILPVASFYPSRIGVPTSVADPPMHRYRYTTYAAFLMGISDESAASGFQCSSQTIAPPLNITTPTGYNSSTVIPYSSDAFDPYNTTISPVTNKSGADYGAKVCDIHSGCLWFGGDIASASDSGNQQPGCFNMKEVALKGN